MSDTSQKSSSSSSRRSFLKIGAGVVAGAAIATVVEVPYYSSVLGGNSSSSSSSVSSLKNQLSSTQQQLSSTAAQLNAAQGQVSSLNNQLSSTAAQLTSANSQLSGVSSQLSSTQQALTSANGQISTLNGQVSTLQGQVSSASSQITTLQSQVSTASQQVTGLQSEIGQMIGYVTLNSKEASILESIAETIIPSDSTGAGAKEAGVTYFIDRQLTAGYGNNSRMYMQGPFLLPSQSGPVTVDQTTYPGGTPTFAYDAGFGYQYGSTLKDFWKAGLASFEAYSNSAYGGDFEGLTSDNKLKVLQDLAAGKPTNFTSGPSPNDFFRELYRMVWSGFLSDPIYGGNRNMVGWSLIGFNGLNTGNFYGEGLTSKILMVASTPTRLKPASKAMIQAQGT